MSSPTNDRYEPGALVAGRYRVDRVLGRGGMGEVYRAEHVELHRPVALKVLKPDIAQDPEVVARFLREARAAAAIGHAGIVEVFDLGRDGDDVFLAMELLEGEEFAELIKRASPLAPALVARIGADLADAVHAAHTHGVVHRDLKPQNVFLVRRSERLLVKVLDFGIAKLIQGDDPAEALTRTGQVFGTPLYMSSEQLRGLKDVDARADVYSIGVVLYEALCGEPPFTASTYSELILKICAETPIPMSQHRPDLPVSLTAIVERAMHRERERRPQSAAELRDALEAFVAGADTSTIDAGRPSADPAFAATLASTPGVRERTGPVPDPRPSRTDVAAGHSSRPKIAIAIAAAVILVGAAGALAMAFANPSPDVPSEASVEPSPTEPVRALPQIDPPSIGSEPREPTPPGPAMRSVSFDVSPSGVAVVVNEEHVCDSPCTAELPDEPSVMTFSREGYLGAERVFASPLPPRVTLQLEPAPPTPIHRRRRPSDDPPPLPSR